MQALRAVKDIPSPSARVQRLIGTPSVSEASALLSSNHGELIVYKQKSVGMTVAIARVVNDLASFASHRSRRGALNNEELFTARIFSDCWLGAWES